MKQEKVFFKNSKGQKIAGLLSLPDVEKSPIVIVIHGFKGTKEYYPMVNNAVKPLVDNGIAVLRIDCRGSGESDMEFKNMTMHTEAEDILTAVDYCKTLNIDPSRIGIIAISMAASATIIAKPKVKSIVFWGPAWKFGQGSYYDRPEHRKTIEEEGVFYVTQGFTGKKLIAGKELFEEMLHLDLTPDYPKLARIPILILRGENDEIVGSADDKRIAEFMNAEYRIIPNTGHNFLEKKAEKELIQQTVDWFKKYLK